WTSTLRATQSFPGRHHIPPSTNRWMARGGRPSPLRSVEDESIFSAWGDGGVVSWEGGGFDAGSGQTLLRCVVEGHPPLIGPLPSQLPSGRSYCKGHPRWSCRDGARAK